MKFEFVHDNDHEEWAALYAAGALDGEEVVSFEEHLRTGCKICGPRLREFENVAESLGAVVSKDPPASLKSAVLDLIQEEVSTHLGNRAAILLQRPGLLVSRSEEMPWIQTPLPGMKIKRLFVDSVRKYSTSLVTLEAGSFYPAHKHNDIEEFFVLEGDLFGEGIRMGPGDFCRSEAGTVHASARTESGALLLVWSSQRDEFI